MPTAESRRRRLLVERSLETQRRERQLHDALETISATARLLHRDLERLGLVLRAHSEETTLLVAAATGYSAPRRGEAA